MAGGASGRRLTRAAREATAGCPPMRDERGVRASAKVPRTGARRRGTRGAAGSGPELRRGRSTKRRRAGCARSLGTLAFPPFPRSRSLFSQRAPVSPRPSSRNLVALSQDALAVHSRNPRASPRPSRNFNALRLPQTLPVHSRDFAPPSFPRKRESSGLLITFSSLRRKRGLANQARHAIKHDAGWNVHKAALARGAPSS